MRSKLTQRCVDFLTVGSLFALLIAGITARNTSPKGLGDACHANSECDQIPNAYCEIISPSCGKGTCLCVPGFGETDGICKRKAILNQQCDERNDLCEGTNVQCTNGRCQCAQGYKNGLKGADCISNLKTERYGSTCYDSVQCYYNMVCIDNECRCYPGFKRIGDYDCAPRQVSETCSDESECSKAGNATCDNGVCICRAGFKKVSHVGTLVDKRTSMQSCIQEKDSLRKEGDPCEDDPESGKTLKFCQKPFVCMECEKHVKICALQWPGFNSPASNITPLPLITILLFHILSTLALLK